MASGRKSLKDELTVLRRYEQLAPKVFQFVMSMFDSEKVEDRKWAADWIKPAYAKMIPQKIGGDPDNQTPIPLIHVIRNNDSNKQNSPDEGKDKGGAGGNISVQDSLHPNLLDSLSPKRQD